MERIDWTEFTVVETIELDDEKEDQAPTLSTNVGFASESEMMKHRQEIARSEPIKSTGLENMDSAFEDLIKKQGVPISSSLTKCTICDKTIPASEHSEHIKTHFPSSSAASTTGASRQEKQSEGVFRPPVEISNISRTTASTAMLIQQQKRLQEEMMKSQEGLNNQLKGPQIPQGMRLPPVPAKPTGQTDGSGRSSGFGSRNNSEVSQEGSHLEVISVNVSLPEQIQREHPNGLSIQIDPRTTISQLKELISESISIIYPSKHASLASLTRIL